MVGRQALATVEPQPLVAVEPPAQASAEVEAREAVRTVEAEPRVAEVPRAAPPRPAARRETRVPPARPEAARQRAAEEPTSSAKTSKRRPCRTLGPRAAWCRSLRIKPSAALVR